MRPASISWGKRRRAELLSLCWPFGDGYYPSGVKPPLSRGLQHQWVRESTSSLLLLLLFLSPTAQSGGAVACLRVADWAADTPQEKKPGPRPSSGDTKRKNGFSQITLVHLCRWVIVNPWRCQVVAPLVWPVLNPPSTRKERGGGGPPVGRVTRLLFTSCPPLHSPCPRGVFACQHTAWGAGQKAPLHVTRGVLLLYPFSPAPSFPFNHSKVFGMRKGKMRSLSAGPPFQVQLRSFYTWHLEKKVQSHRQTLAGIVCSLAPPVVQLLNGKFFEGDVSLSHVLGMPAVIPRSSHVLPPAVCDGRKPARQN